MITCASLKNPGLLADFIASNVLMRYADKMGILEQFDPMKRLEKLILTIQPADPDAPHCEPMPAYFTRPKGLDFYPAVLFS
ncbi:MAG: LON peptidase substrate-binding domain-containing protein, partial [Clostridia bacterium]|nr:LON peptidase substrate-binding domain-containing protein [Clostridia bacterium]